MLKLTWLLERLGLADEREAWLASAAESGDQQAMQAYRDLLSDQGRTAESDHWLVRLAEAGDGAAIWEMGERHAWSGESEEAERWFGRLPFGNTGSRQLAVRLERAGRTANAEHRYRRAMDGGDSTAAEYLALLLDQQGRSAEAEQARRRAFDLVAEEVGQARGGDADHPGEFPDARWPAEFELGLTVVETVLITTALVPFVQGVLTKAGEGTYEAVRRKLRLLFQKHSDHGQSPGRGDLIVVADPALAFGCTCGPTPPTRPSDR